ncbi:MAG: hypothetical protein OXT73_04810 [Bacteroidota bacterium]|nr:hypothetical protein [Bacteroidota bacterium]
MLAQRDRMLEKGDDVGSLPASSSAALPSGAQGEEVVTLLREIRDELRASRSA